MNDDQIFEHFQSRSNRDAAMKGMTEQEAGDALDIAALRAGPEAKEPVQILSTEEAAAREGLSVEEFLAVHAEFPSSFMGE